MREFETSPQTTQALLAHAVDIQYDDAAVMTAAVKNLPDKVKITSTEQFFPTVGGIGIHFIKLMHVVCVLNSNWINLFTGFKLF